MTAAAELLDVEAFADGVLGRGLWPHQLDVARSGARYRVICAGRQVGKSVLLAVLALHTAATRRGATVLLVSAGEEASKRLLGECAALARTVVAFALGTKYSGDAESQYYLLGFKGVSVWLPVSEADYASRVRDFAASGFYRAAPRWGQWLATVFGAQ